MKARPGDKPRNVRRHFRLVPRAAVLAGPAVAVVLRDLRGHRRDIHDLMGEPEPHLGLRRRADLPTAPLALLGIELDEVVDLVRREGLSIGSRVTGLTAGFTSRRRRRHSGRRSVRRIRTGWPRGVGRVSAEAVLQRPNPRLQSNDHLSEGFVFGPQERVLLLEFYVRRPKLRVLSFEFRHSTSKSRSFCFHPLKLEHAGAKKDSSQMRNL